MSIVEAYEAFLQTWPTVVLSLIVGLGGGTVGAIIGATSQGKREKAQQRKDAREALKGFERVLLDWSLEYESKLLQDDTTPFTTTSFTDLAAAREKAYPYAHYLPKASRKLVTQQWMSDGYFGNPMDVSNEVHQRGTDLGTAIDKALPPAA
jgi:hypothetical protein